MKVQAKAGPTFAALDDPTAGEGLAIFFSQGAADITRWRFEVYAKLSSGQELLVGFFFVSPPSATDPVGQLTRQVGAAVCPGAKSWSVVVFPEIGSVAAANEDADLTLTSSKCCTAPVGVSRVGERYAYRAGTNVGGIAAGIFAGQTIKGVSAVGLAGGGSIQIGTGNVVTVPAGVGVSLDTEGLNNLPTSSASITFTNVAWVFEYLESA